MTGEHNNSSISFNTCAHILTMMDEESKWTVDPSLNLAKFICESVLNPILCVVGIIGNGLNVFVLTRKKFQTGLDCNHERVAVIGLLFLALSDTLFCVCSIPQAFIGGHKTVSRKIDFLFLYQLYGNCVRNYFLYTSIWLTVMTAVSRYLAICKPLHTRGLVSNKAIYIAITSIFLFWALFTLPSYWKYHVTIIHPCPQRNISVYLLDSGYFVKHRQMKLVFSYLWSFFGFLLPVIILSYCNYHLVKAVRESMRMRELYRVHSRNKNPGSNITPTLVGVICMFIVCNSPSEILQFFFYSVQRKHTELFTTALMVTNVLLTLNYSMNFLLYCLINSRFRKTIDHMIRCGSFADLRRQFSMSTRNGTSRRGPTQITYNITNSPVSEVPNKELELLNNLADVTT